MIPMNRCHSTFFLNVKTAIGIGFWVGNVVKIRAQVLEHLV